VGEGSTVVPFERAMLDSYGLSIVTTALFYFGAKFGKEEVHRDGKSKRHPEET